MKIIVPMAGQGQRFADADYTDPKPFIKVAGKMIVEYIVDMFDRKNDEFIFVVNEMLPAQYRLQLRNLAPDCRIYPVPVNNLGPVYSCIQSGVLGIIEDDEEIIVSYCDNPFLMDYSLFKRQKDFNKSDGIIFSHVGFHPHRLSSTYMAYMKTNGKHMDPQVLEIKEKEPYTTDPMYEHASTGTYYFRKGSYIKKYFQELMDKKLCHTNGEYYVTLVYNLMIADGLQVQAWKSDFVTVFGTPEEVKNYEAWQTILEGSQVKNNKDLKFCYYYWQMYNEHKKTV